MNIALLQQGPAEVSYIHAGFAKGTGARQLTRVGSGVDWLLEVKLSF